MRRIILVALLLATSCVDGTPTPVPPTVTPASTMTPTATLTATPDRIGVIETREHNVVATLYIAAPTIGYLMPTALAMLSAPTQTPTPTTTPTAIMEGKARWYGPGYIGDPMKNGDDYDPDAFTCAVSLRDWDELGGLWLRVCLIEQPDTCVEVQVTDTGDAEAFEATNTKVDLSMRAFAVLAELDVGVVDVKVWIIEKKGE